MKLNFRRTKRNVVYAPVNGVSFPIEKVKDETFNKKLMGDGLAICTYDPLLVSPVDGTVKVITNTKHALMIQSGDLELLIHVGIDTCTLNGDGFELLVQLEQKVKVGDPMLKINHALFQEKELNSDVLLVFTNCSNNQIHMNTEQEVIKGQSIVAEIL